MTTTNNQVLALAERHGFHKTDTGGGCEALRRDWKKHHALITALDDPSLPDAPDEQCVVGFYTHEQEHSEPVLQFTCPAILEALVLAGRLNEDGAS